MRFPNTTRVVLDDILNLLRDTDSYSHAMRIINSVAAFLNNPVSSPFTVEHPNSHLVNYWSYTHKQGYFTC